MTETSESSVTVEVGKMRLLPPAPGLCQECATKHEPGWPHNAQSLYYQFKFPMDHGRAPTWADAMAHCDDTTREFWTKELTRMGVDVNSTNVSPQKKVGGQ
jgi:hypothetical protein